jgi:molybdate transport system regulatory protein
METKSEGAGLTLRIRLMRGEEVVFGPGRADLLAAIRDTGSIAAAGRRMGMSYKRAWALVEVMNAMFAAPLVEAAKGGAGGGGARITPVGALVLAAYRGIEAAAGADSGAFMAQLGEALAPAAVEPCCKK